MGVVIQVRAAMNDAQQQTGPNWEGERLLPLLLGVNAAVGSRFFSLLITTVQLELGIEKAFHEGGY